MAKKKASKSKAKKTKSKKSEKVEVHKVKDKQLLDDKLKRKTDSYRVSLGLTFLAFLVFAVAVFVYLFFVRPQNTLTRDFEPSIVVPESATQQLEEEEDETESSESVEVEVLMVRITDTPTGWLNVRRGPGTNYEIIGRVNPGETYEYVSENEQAGWYEMRLSGGTGWVTGQYAELYTATTTRETTE